MIDWKKIAKLSNADIRGIIDTLELILEEEQ